MENEQLSEILKQRIELLIQTHNELLQLFEEIHKTRVKIQWLLFYIAAFMLISYILKFIFEYTNNKIEWVTIILICIWTPVFIYSIYRLIKTKWELKKFAD